MGIEVKATKYSINDSDIEHLNRKGYSSLPPRVLRPQVLDFYGLDLFLLKQMNLFITNSAMEFQKKSKFSFTGIKERYIRSPSELYIPGTKIKPPKPPEGDVVFWIDTSVGSGKPKSVIDVRHLPKKWAFLWNFIFWGWLDQARENIYPKHMHFIMRDSVVSPLPFKYFEFYLKFEKGNAGNVFADFMEGDTVNDSILSGTDDFY